MRVGELLPTNRSTLICVAPTGTVGEAIALMREQRVGSVLILDEDRRLLGVLSERDVVHALASGPVNLLEQPALSIAQTNSPTANPEDTVQSIMALMTATHTRHVPVIRFGRVMGIVSIGDVVKSRLEEKTQENAVLQEIARAQYFAS